MKAARLGMFIAPLALGWLAPQAFAQEAQTERQRRIAELKAKQLAESTAVVKGRCIDALTGKPMAGCRVEFEGRASNRSAMALHGAPDWKDPQPVITGLDGRFIFRFVPPPPYQHSIDISVDGRYPRTGRWGAFKPGQVDDLGDIEMRPGQIVTGRVVNQDGEPIRKLSVGFNDLCLPISIKPGARAGAALGAGQQPEAGDRWAENASHSAANQLRYGSTDENGTFKSLDMIPPGTWPIYISRSGLKLIQPLQVTVPEGGTMEPLEIVVREQPSIRGTVVDEKGLPVSRVYLKAEQHQSGRMASGYARTDGRFVIYRTDTVDQQAVRLEVADPRNCEMPPGPTEPIKWGTDDVVIRLKRALTFELEVLEAGTGKPVEAFSVICHAANARGSSPRSVRLGGEHPGGKVVVDRVWRGRNQLTVIPRDPQLAISRTIDFEASDDEPGPSQVEVERMKPLKITLLDAAGKAVPGRKVELILVGSSPFAADDQFILTRTHRGGWSSNPNHRFHEQLFAADTDKYGQCWLYGLAGRDNLLIRVQPAPGELPFIVTDVEIDEQHVSKTIRIE